MARAAGQVRALTTSGALTLRVLCEAQGSVAGLRGGSIFVAGLVDDAIEIFNQDLTATTLDSLRLTLAV